MRDHSDNIELMAEASYFTGASYANLFDFLIAKKNFKEVVEKYKGSSYYEDAYIGLGEVEFLLENYKEALRIYVEFCNANPSLKRMATLYFRLAEVNLKLGNKDEYKKYLKLLKTEFPKSFEARDASRLVEADSFYTVQVGAFTNYENAEKFITDLKAKGYEVYSVLCLLADKKLCRIRIGRFKTSQEAEELKQKLETEGYFAKVFPFE
jgi:tetratricopeptide (TPR) repeat protein